MSAPATPEQVHVRVQLAEAVGLLRSGATPAVAWEAVGLGPVDTTGVPQGLPTSDAGLAVSAACTLAHHSGAPLADVLEAVGEHLERELEAHASRQAALAGPAMSAAVLSWLPLAGVALGALVEVRALYIVAATPLGWVLLVCAGALTWCGRAWMRRMVAQAVRAGRDDPGGPEDASGRDGAAGRDGVLGRHRAAGRESGPVVPITLMLALIDSAIAGGVEVRGALAAVGHACGGSRGVAVTRVADALAAGVAWEAAWERTPASLAVVERALRGAWASGMAPRAMVRAQMRVAALSSRMESEHAIGELGVRMALPLTLCLLPAFALVGLVPMVVAVASTAGVALSHP